MTLIFSPVCLSLCTSVAYGKSHTEIWNNFLCRGLHFGYGAVSYILMRLSLHPGITTQFFTTKRHGMQWSVLLEFLYALYGFLCFMSVNVEVCSVKAQLLCLPFFIIKCSCSVQKLI